MELFDNIRNCNKNAAAVKKAKKREKVQCGIIAALTGSLIGMVITHHASKKEYEKFKKRLDVANDKAEALDKKTSTDFKETLKDKVDTATERLSNAKKALKGDLVDVTDFTEVEEPIDVEVKENDN